MFGLLHLRSEEQVAVLTAEPEISREDSSTYLWCKNLEESLNEQDIFIGPGTELEFDRRMEIAQKVLNNAFPLNDLIKKYGIS